MATLTLTHLGQASGATNYRTHPESWALIFRAWYPYATAAYLVQGLFLLMYFYFHSINHSPIILQATSIC